MFEAFFFLYIFEMIKYRILDNTYVPDGLCFTCVFTAECNTDE